MVAAYIYIKEEEVLERMNGAHLRDDPGQGNLLGRGHIIISEALMAISLLVLQSMGQGTSRNSLLRPDHFVILCFLENWIFPVQFVLPVAYGNTLLFSGASHWINCTSHKN